MTVTLLSPETRSDNLLGALPWKGEVVVCIASGPSAKKVDYGLIAGRARALAINESWRLYPEADALYGCDPEWWRRSGPTAEQFKGLRITQDKRAATRHGLKLVRLTRGEDRILTKTPGVLGWGNNSGFHAVNILAQAGVSKIILVGYDLSRDGGIHWHGPHGLGLSNPARSLLARWAQTLDAQAPVLADLGIAVINTSPASALTAFPKMTLREALDGD